MLLVDKKTGEVSVSPFSKFDKPTVGHDCGSMIIQNYDFTWSDEIRDFVVTEADKEDRQAYIDSFADDCGVYQVLKKFAKSGDLSLLNRAEGFYGDISGLPVDELNPAKYAAAAEASTSKLSKVLGVDLTVDQLAALSPDELNDLIAKAVEAKTAKTEKVEEKKEGE